MAIKEENEKDFLPENTTFQLYSLLQKIIVHQEKSSFLDLERIFFAEVKTLKRVDQQMVFFSGLNYAIRQMNQGKAAFATKAFEWYKLGLLNELLIENELISEATFGNVVVIACRERQFTWAEKFIEDYQQFLKSMIRADIVAFNIASIQLYQNKFEETLEFLATHHFSNVFQPRIRFMEIRALFELFLKDNEYFELLTSKLDAAINFYKRNTLLSKSSLEPYLNGVKLIRRLTNQVLERKKKKIILGWLEEERKKRSIMGINWLIQRFK